MKMQRHTISMLSVTPQAGSQGADRYRGSDVRDKEEGLSKKARPRMTAMVVPRPLHNINIYKCVSTFKWAAAMQTHVVILVT